MTRLLQQLLAARHQPRWSGWFVLVALLLLAQPTSGQNKQPSEYDVKAAMLVNFAKFVDWPANVFNSTDAPVIIGIYGSDPFGAVLDELVKNQEVSGRRLEIRRFTSGETATNCHLVYCSVSSTDTDKLLAGARLAPVVFVSDTETFTRQGGHIGFYIQESKVRFEVNLAAFERSGLKMHSQVLKLAPRVTRDGKDVKK
jgi:hypothetical protein